MNSGYHGEQTRGGAAEEPTQSPHDGICDVAENEWTRTIRKEDFSFKKTFQNLGDPGEVVHISLIKGVFVVLFVFVKRGSQFIINMRLILLNLVLYMV